MKKTLSSLLLVGSLLFPNVSEGASISFESTAVDTGQNIISNPAVIIDRINGLEHMIYGRENELIYTNSDDFNNKIVLDSTPGTYSSPTLRMNIGHDWYAVYNRDNQTYYIDSINLTPVALGLGVQQGEQIDIDLGGSNTRYVVGQKNNGVNGSDIYILKSDDGLNFTEYLHIDKPGDQRNPRIAIKDAQVDNISIVYEDNIDGKFKVKYRDSSDNFTTEQNISNADYSYSPTIEPSVNSQFFVTYKDSAIGYDTGQIWVTDKYSGWARTPVTGLIEYLEDRPVSFTVDDNDVRYLSWSTNDGVSNNIFYTDSNKNYNNFLVDSTDNLSLGYVDMDTAVNQLYVAANIHSIYNYELIESGGAVPEPSTSSLIGLGAGLLGAYALRRKGK